MKNKKISVKTVIIVIIGIIIAFIITNLNNKNNNLEQQLIQKEQLGETTGDNAYVDMQKHTSEVQEKEQKLMSFKTAIANAITEMGVETAVNADASTMANNIKSLSGGSYTSSDFVIGIEKTSNHSGKYTCPVKGLYFVATDLYAAAGVNYSHSVTTTGTMLLQKGRYLNPGAQLYNCLSIILANEGDTISITCTTVSGSSPYTLLAYVPI